MDPSQFDRLTQMLAAGLSRRRALGGVLAGALALVGGQEAAARCNQKDKKKRRKCRRKPRRPVRGSAKLSAAQRPALPARSAAIRQLVQEGGCTLRQGSPFAAQSTGRTHRGGTTCCDSVSSGQLWCLAMTPDFRIVASPALVGGAVWWEPRSVPVTIFGGYCCPASTVLLPDIGSVSGCCIAQEARRQRLPVESVETVPRHPREERRAIGLEISQRPALCG